MFVASSVELIAVAEVRRIYQSNLKWIKKYLQKLDAKVLWFSTSVNSIYIFLIYDHLICL